jgi:hypothetical protein
MGNINRAGYGPVHMGVGFISLYIQIHSTIHLRARSQVTKSRKFALPSLTRRAGKGRGAREPKKATLLKVRVKVGSIYYISVTELLWLSHPCI